MSNGLTEKRFEEHITECLASSPMYCQREHKDFDIKSLCDLGVLPNFGAKSGRIFCDGPNANRVARDYVSKQVQVMGNKVKVHLAKGGGAVMVF